MGEGQTENKWAALQAAYEDGLAAQRAQEAQQTNRQQQLAEMQMLRDKLMVQKTEIEADLPSREVAQEVNETLKEREPTLSEQRETLAQQTSEFDTVAKDLADLKETLTALEEDQRPIAPELIQVQTELSRKMGNLERSIDRLSTDVERNNQAVDGYRRTLETLPMTQQKLDALRLEIARLTLTKVTETGPDGQPIERYPILEQVRERKTTEEEAREDVLRSLREIDQSLWLNPEKRTFAESQVHLYLTDLFAREGVYGITDPEERKKAMRSITFAVKRGVEASRSNYLGLLEQVKRNSYADEEVKTAYSKNLLRGIILGSVAGGELTDNHLFLAEWIANADSEQPRLDEQVKRHLQNPAATLTENEQGLRDRIQTELEAFIPLLNRQRAFLEVERQLPPDFQHFNRDIILNYRYQNNNQQGAMRLLADWGYTTISGQPIMPMDWIKNGQEPNLPMMEMNQTWNKNTEEASALIRRRLEDFDRRYTSRIEKARAAREHIAVQTTQKRQALASAERELEGLKERSKTHQLLVLEYEVVIQTLIKDKTDYETKLAQLKASWVQRNLPGLMRHIGNEDASLTGQISALSQQIQTQSEAKQQSQAEVEQGVARQNELAGEITTMQETMNKELGADELRKLADELDKLVADHQQLRSILVSLQPEAPAGKN